ncbi:MAG: TIGR03000 domain-containing protein [Gemmataceae bacterium]
MRIAVPVWQGLAVALLAVVLAADTVQAQAPGAPEATIRRNLSLMPALGAGGAPGAPGSTTYPYWATAPQGFAPSRVTVPVPPPSLYTISRPASSVPTQTNVGVGIGGGLTLPFMTVKDATLDNKAHIWLRVPKSAAIWVNGVKTKQTGELRHFFSPPLTPGKKYSYQMRLRWMKDGKPVEETQRILVQAFQTIHRDFTHSR